MSGSGIRGRAVSDPLERLLHRCHRDELLPLAELAGVPHEGVGLSDLAERTAREVRRKGRHALANAAFRGGEGPPYWAILSEHGAGALSDGASDSELEAAEMAVVRSTWERAWGRLRPEGRAEMWRALGLEGDAPPDGSGAMAEAQGRLGRAFGFALTEAQRVAHDRHALGMLVALSLTPVGCLLRPLFALFLPIVVWWALRPDERRVLAVILSVARLRQIVLRRITIGLVGSPSTGKDAGIRALFGIDSGNISPIAGSTREVAIQRVPGATALYVVNTPGLGDVVQSVTDEAKQVLQHIDVFIYVVNAEGGVQARELADYQACVAQGKPTLVVVNKIDVLRPKDKDRYLADALQKIGAAPEDFLPVAFDPLPQLAPGPIGISAVHDWLAQSLTELGKDPAEMETIRQRGAPPLASPPQAAPALRLVPPLA